MVETKFLVVPDHRELLPTPSHLLTDLSLPPASCGRSCSYYLLYIISNSLANLRDRDCPSRQCENEKIAKSRAAVPVSSAAQLGGARS
eukprot:scaffold7753_cov149-Ochromonas_danica.AAC.1